VSIGCNLLIIRSVDEVKILTKFSSKRRQIWPIVKRCISTMGLYRVSKNSILRRISFVFLKMPLFM